jgi:hypothetical protein
MQYRRIESSAKFGWSINDYFEKVKTMWTEAVCGLLAYRSQLHSQSVGSSFCVYSRIPCTQDPSGSSCPLFFGKFVVQEEVSKVIH